MTRAATVLAVVLAQGLASVAAVAASAAFVSSAPLVLMNGESVAACGVRLMVSLDETSLAVDLLLAKEAGDGKPKAVLRAGYEPAELRSLPVTRLSLATTSVATSDIFVMPGRHDEWARFIQEADASDLRISPLIQELMVGGARLEIAREFLLEPDTVTVPGPLPQGVRAAYLNCAGDLYRPDE